MSRPDLSKPDGMFSLNQQLPRNRSNNWWISLKPSRFFVQNWINFTILDGSIPGFLRPRLQVSTQETPVESAGGCSDQCPKVPMRTIGRSLVISGPRPILEPYHKTVVWAICEEKFEWSHFWGQPGCRWLPGCDLDRPGLMLNRKAKFEQIFFNNFFFFARCGRGQRPQTGAV